MHNVDQYVFEVEKMPGSWSSLQVNAFCEVRHLLLGGGESDKWEGQLIIQNEKVHSEYKFE